MAPTITGISSKATRLVLAELTARYQEATGRAVSIEAVGAVDAFKRVRAGEAFDLVVLANNLMQTLEAEGHLIAGSSVAFVRSPMALAVRAGAPWPDISGEEAVKAAMMSARSIGYSTGASGTHLVAVWKSWGLDAAGDPRRFVQAKPGVPIASLVASGEVAIGIQQLSELLGEPGIDIVGILPPPVQSVTTFSIGIGAQSTQREAVRAAVAYFNAAEAAETKRRFKMEPA